MGKRRHVPTISGGEGNRDRLFLADMLPEGDPGMIDLHGLTADEAAREMDRFLDQAVASGTEAVKVVHGKGSGTLAALVRRIMGTDPRVKSFRPSTSQVGAAMVAEIS